MLLVQVLLVQVLLVILCVLVVEVFNEGFYLTLFDCGREGLPTEP